MNEAEMIIKEIEKIMPEYLENELDYSISQGNVSVCIIDEENNIYGRMFGSDKMKSRESFRVAWIKASQVWITGYKTGEFEKKVFLNEIDENKFEILRPDYIGWEGGQPVVLKNGKRLSIGFSGFRGTSDLEIVARAVKQS